MGMNNEMTNYTELIVDKKVSGLYLLRRILMWVAYVALLPLIVAVCCIIWPNASGYFIGGFLIVGVILYYCFLLPKIIYPGTYRYVQIAYEYRIKGGNIEFNTVYGRKTRKPLVPAMLVSSYETFAPYKGEYKAAADDKSLRRYEACEYLEHPDNYYGIFTNEKGERSVVIFQCSNAALKILKFLNRNTVDSGETLSL